MARMYPKYRGGKPDTASKLRNVIRQLHKAKEAVMFDFSETGPGIENGRVQFRIYLPGIDQQRGFGVKAYAIDKREQFDARIQA